MSREPTLNDIKKFLSQKIKESGFSLENELEKTLESRQHNVLREVPFYDKDEQKGRKIDIQTTKTFPEEGAFGIEVKRACAQISLVMECKNILGNIWTFHQSSPRGFAIPDHASIKLSNGDPAFNVLPTYPIDDIPYASGYDEYIFEERKSNKKIDNLFNAIMSVTKATRYLKEDTDKMFKILMSSNWRITTNQNYFVLMTFFQPVIVFTGRMFMVKDNDIQPIKYVQIDKNYVSKDYNERGLIHVVQHDSISEYLTMIENYYRTNENFLIEAREDLLRSVETYS